MADDKAPFLARWSQRKVRSRELPTKEAPATPPMAAAVGTAGVDAAAISNVPAAPAEPKAPTGIPAPPPPTLEDVGRLTRDSDFSSFVTRNVEPDVRNAALKKLFTDPQFNVMDGLDTYIDDYGRPDPLPRSMLRQMAQAATLGLFDDENDGSGNHDAGDDQEPDQDDTAPAKAALNNEDPDLQLQSDDAAGRPRTEPGAGEDPAGQR
jgi:hypothetical protein